MQLTGVDYFSIMSTCIVRYDLSYDEVKVYDEMTKKVKVYDEVNIYDEISSLFTYCT